VGPAVGLPISLVVVVLLVTLRRALLEVPAGPAGLLLLRLLLLRLGELLGSRRRGRGLGVLELPKHHLRVKSRLLGVGEGVHGSCVCWGDGEEERRRDEEGR